MKSILTLLLSFTAFAHAEPVKMIFDTDMGNDIDDAMALAMIHQLEARGAVELLAVTSTKDHPLSAAYIDALNTYYGQPDIPIGAVRDGATKQIGKYNELAKKTGDNGDLLYPHDLESGEDAPDAVPLLRKVLAEQSDHSVMLVQVGFFTNFARLLDSKPDESSDLGGKELIENKVKELVIMAGAFQTIVRTPGNTEHKANPVPQITTKHVEYNVKNDIPAAKKIAERWPTPVVWSGFEIGIAATYPWKSIVEDYEYVPNHLIKDSYIAYAPETPHDRPTWDLTAALYAIFPDRGYFDLTPAGFVTVDDEGRTDYSPGGGKEGANDRFLLMNETQTARVREAFVQLCSEPPRK